MASDPSNPNQITKLDRKRFPRDVIEKVNELVDAANKPTEYKFATDSNDPIAKIVDTPTKRVVTLPRGGLNTTGTAATPYVMGANSTVTDPLLAKNDSWTLKDGPNPPGGGPYDGVSITSFERWAQDGDPQVFADIPLTIVTIRVFDRGVKWDSFGKIYAIGPEVLKATADAGGITFVTSP